MKFSSQALAAALTLCTTLTITCVKAQQCNTTVSVTTSIDATALATAIVAANGGPDIVSATITGPSQCAGFFEGGDLIAGADMPTSGIVLSSGAATSVQGPNVADYTGTSFGGAGDSDLQTLIPNYNLCDACVLEMAFTCPVGKTAIVVQDYVFLSDEFTEYANSSFNDAFGFFLNGQSIATLPGTNTPVTIDSIFNSGQYFVNNDPSFGTPPICIEGDGFSTKLAATGATVQGQVNTIKLGVADAGDCSFDSWVLLQGGSFACCNSPTDCPVLPSFPVPVPITAAPTTAPSDLPSAGPSDTPSSLPSQSPSDQPSALPSGSPSSLPSQSPSDQPSALPSESPTAADCGDTPCPDSPNKVEICFSGGSARGGMRGNTDEVTGTRTLCIPKNSVESHFKQNEQSRCGPCVETIDI